jgi:hypothetical protein
MIPANITRDHVLLAIKEISQQGVPEKRQSRDFVLLFQGNLFPPKYVISVANRYANGRELDPSQFSGGRESNSFLIDLGFEISRRITRRPVFKGDLRNPNSRAKIAMMCGHDERCKGCKESVRNFLERIYGEVRSNYTLGYGALPADFADLPFHATLQEIYQSLQQFRSQTDFVHTQVLPPVDFFVPNPGFVVEFDESQHFTACRKLALSKYPSNLPLGFNKEKWSRLCNEIDARDNEPAYRDEQRAWYDTLRDFVPVANGLKPTVRLAARDFVWCSMNPDNESDVKTFRNILEGSANGWEIELRKDLAPSLARIVIAGEWYGKPEQVRRLLKAVCEKWPTGKGVKFLMTCGGFIEFEWPRFISRYDIGDNLNPNEKALRDLIKEATKAVQNVLTDDVTERLREVTDYITLGVDSYKEVVSTTQNYISQLHIELVLIADLRAKRFYWTGKSYPTPAQQRGLVRLPDLGTHFLKLGDAEEVMILGCHDLTLFNNRNWGRTKGWRKHIKVEFRKLAKEHKPMFVLQHPHTTDSVMTWNSAWRELERELPSVKMYASAGRYHNTQGERSDLYEVLDKTKHGDSLDFIVHTHD